MYIKLSLLSRGWSFLVSYHLLLYEASVSMYLHDFKGSPSSIFTPRRGGTSQQDL